MTDLTLLLFGSGVSFIFFAGCYIAFRDRFTKIREAPRAGEPFLAELKVVEAKPMWSQRV